MLGSERYGRASVPRLDDVVSGELLSHCILVRAHKTLGQHGDEGHQRESDHQRRSGRGGASAVTDRVALRQRSGELLADVDEVLVTEIYFNYVPAFRTYIYSGSTLYAVAYTRPRNHNLMTSPGTPICPTN